MWYPWETGFLAKTYLKVMAPQLWLVFEAALSTGAGRVEKGAWLSSGSGQKRHPQPKRVQVRVSVIVATVEAPMHIREATSKNKPPPPPPCPHFKGVLPQGTHSHGRGPAAAFLPTGVDKAEEKSSSPGLRFTFSIQKNRSISTISELNVVHILLNKEHL